MDPGPLTLADLVTMAAARRRDEWDRTAAIMSWVARVWGGARIDPAKLNPFRSDAGGRVDPARLTPEQRRALADRQIDALEEMFGGRAAGPRRRRTFTAEDLEAYAALRAARDRGPNPENN